MPSVSSHVTSGHNDRAASVSSHVTSGHNDRA